MAEPKSVADAYADDLRPDEYDLRRQEKQAQEEQAKTKTLLDSLATLPSGAQYLKVNNRQKGNAVLKELKQVPRWYVFLCWLTVLRDNVSYASSTRHDNCNQCLRDS
eukprot:m.261962 g.261962  ORF g.261962 m.261962 type:complete len:107 (+) comp17605_c0_seq16:7082-7402(+)